MAEIFLTQDGSHSIFSSQFGVSYHSKYGALQETEHVFIREGLYPAMLGRENLDILEIGFGSGLNALVTCREAIAREWSIRYETWEAFPLPEEQVVRLNFSQVLQAPELQDTFLAMHRLEAGAWHELFPNFQFRRIAQRFEALEAVDEFDLVYYDAFAPSAQPELWELPVLEKVARSLRPGGMLVTYSAKGAFKRHMKSLGFRIESPSGPPGKREMTRCIKDNG